MQFPRRVILHIDMDAFFAQAELLALPALRGKPLIIGGSPGQRGVVATASYEARPYGIHSGMSLTEAQHLCPHAVFLPCHPTRYFDLSARILKILLKLTPKVEAASIDEAYLDASDKVDSLQAARAMAQSIQNALLERLSLTCSVGVGPNKLIAKMAAGLDKPSGLTVLNRDEFRRRFFSEPVTTLYGVGKATASALSTLGIERIEQLAIAPDSLLRKRFGIWGPVIGAAARGEDLSPVVPYHETPDPKSLGHEFTLPANETDRSTLRRWLLGLCDEVAGDLRTEDRAGDTVHLKVRYSDFTTRTHQTKLAEPTSSTRKIYRVALGLMSHINGGRPVRLLGVTISNLSRFQGSSTMDLFDSPKSDLLDEATDRIRHRYGRRRIRRASLIPERKR